MVMLYSHSRRLVASTTLCSRHHHHPLSSFISKPTHHYYSSNASSSEEQPTKTTSPKRKTRKTQRNTESIPSLSEFIHRSKVLKQYRSFIRLALFLDKRDNSNDGTNASRKGECRAALEEVRVAYRLGVDKGRTDALARTMAFTEGERRLKELQSMVGIIPRKQTQSSSSSTSHDEEVSYYDPDSWMNIKDEDDKRGRVGVQWPWQRSD
eukprot:scaffold99514_cov22-Cyclotella_meneghiniana.AAC.1